MFNTREAVREFQLAFDRPFRTSLTQLTVTERELLGKLLLEETVEYLTKGLGLSIVIRDSGDTDIELHINAEELAAGNSELTVELNEGQQVDPVECADGLGDVNVVIHFAAHWQGFNLDAVTKVINNSNMSKLGENGKSIINGYTEGYRAAGWDGRMSASESGYDPSKPVGKILKGPNYWAATDEIKRIINMENGNG